MQKLLMLCVLGMFFNASGSERLPGKDKGGYLTVDYLAWKPQEDQLQYAGVIPGGVPAELPFALRPIVFEPVFKFDSGVRLEVGYFFCNNWDIWASWTRFHPCASNRIVADTDGALLATPITGIVGNPQTPANSAQSNFYLKFDTGSINVGRYFEPWDCIALETFMGIQGARIDQKQLLEYEGVVLLETELVSPTPVNRYNKFSGVGPTIGAQFTWNLGQSDWCIFGAASGALLVGKFCTTLFNSITIPNGDELTVDLLGMEEVTLGDPDPLISVTLTQSKCRVRSAGDIQVGLGWEHQFCNNFGLQVRLAFEAQMWPNQWQVYSSVGNVNTGNMPGGGDLTLYGATLGLGLLF